MLELLAQKAFIEFELLLGIANGTATSNHGGEVTPKQWRNLQAKFLSQLRHPHEQHPNSFDA